MVKTLGAFAVNREKPELATFKTVLDLIKTDWSLGIFPEGKICNTHSIENVQKGFTLIAKKANTIIKENYKDPDLTLSSVSDKLGVSYGYLSSIFSICDIYSISQSKTLTREASRKYSR